MMDSLTTPRFTLQERDRRWGRIRELMELAGIDVLLAMDEPNTRYLTGGGDDVGCAVFGLDGAATFLCEQAGQVDDSWVADVRPARGREVERLVERLTELGADRKIVAVTGLDTTVRRPRGNLNYLTFIALREWFPHARWVGGSQLMDEARWQKSGEELDMLQAAAEHAESGLQAGAEAVPSAGPLREVWGQMLRTVIAGGADPTSWVQVITEPSDTDGARLYVLDRPIALARQIELTVLARVQGYGALAVQPVVVGPPDAIASEATQLLFETWRTMCQQLQSGATWSDVVADLPAKAGFTFSVRLDGMGLGDDLPFTESAVTARPYLRERPLVEGVSFALDMQVSWSTGDHPGRIRWADTVVLAAEGVRRLGARPIEAALLP